MSANRKGLQLSISLLDSKHILTAGQEIFHQNGCNQFLVATVMSPQQAKTNDKTEKSREMKKHNVSPAALAI